MIFNQESVTELVVKYQRTKNVDTLASIMEQCKSLVEVIVSLYDSFYRDDLIQEAFLRIQYSIPYYKSAYKLHNYFTTVIHNACCTYLKKQGKYINYDETDETDETLSSTDNADGYDILLRNLQERNRNRFGDIDCAVIDIISYELYHAVIQNNKICRRLISTMANDFKLDKTEIQDIYNSTLMYVRNHYITEAVTNDAITEVEITEVNVIDEDLIEFFGESTYIKLKTLLRGITIKL